MVAEVAVVEMAVETIETVITVVLEAEVAEAAVVVVEADLLVENAELPIVETNVKELQLKADHWFLLTNSCLLTPSS